MGQWAKHFNVKKWIKPEKFENLAKMAEPHQRLSLITLRKSQFEMFHESEN